MQCCGSLPERGLVRAVQPVWVLGCAELMPRMLGLQCLRTSSPARWTWLSWRTARRPWSAWPQGCQLPVSLSPPSSFPGGVPGVRLHAPCISSPSFPADISWYKGNEQLVTTPARILSRDGKRLEIPRAHLSDAGSYRCVASNAAGDTELGYSLRVTGESMGCRGRAEAVRGQGAPPGPPVHVWGQSLRDGFSRDPFVCPVCHYPTSIPGNVPKGHGPTDRHLVQILVSPTLAVPISAPWCCW